MAIITIHSQFAELSEGLSQALDHLVQLKEEIEMMQEMAQDFFLEHPD